MKAQINLAVTATVGVLVVIGVTSLSLVYQSQTVFKNINERNIVESENQMEFIKNNIQQAATYSTYQEIYTLSKYGGYGEYNGICDSKLLEGYPNNLPYWKVFDAVCFPSPALAFQSELKDTVFEKFTQYLESVKSKFGEELTIPAYLGGGNTNCPSGYHYSTEEKTCLCDAIEPDFCPLGEHYYTDVKIFNDKSVLVQVPALDKLKFKSEKLELADKVDVIKFINIPLGRLIEFAKDNFVDIDSIAPEIESAKKFMESVNVIPEKGSWKNFDLNDGELTGYCTKVEFQQCGAFSNPLRSELLPTHCKNDFITKISSNINSLGSKYTSESTYVLVSTENIKTNLDLTDETKCSTNSAESSSCDCISWECRVPNPVVVGDMIEERAYISHAASETDSCAPCISTYVNEDEVEMCVQYAEKACPLETTPLDGNCIGELAPTCPDTGDEDGIPCISASYDNNHDHCHVTEDASLTSCPTSGGYVEEDSDENLVTYKADAICPVGYTLDPVTDKCVKYVSKECPSGTEEHTNGKCYKTPQNFVTCSKFETLHEKTCNYDYKVEALAKISITDAENQYSVYDSGNTIPKNLELNFYMLSKN